MAIARRRRRPLAFDMTPLIDCVFQLLIFFMLSSSLISPNLRLTLPKASTGAPGESPEIVVSLTREGTIFVNNEPTPVAALTERLRPLVQRSQTKLVTFRGDEQAPYQFFVQVLDAARKAGAANMHLAHR
ncbi:MAG: biopolymer transporter ExbD [Gemmataceae bacterium]|nr:biopolymer transporter ExbD [Gemmataceae bacterium]